MELSLQDRVVVITGASKGIGLATTEAFLEEGACVVAASRTPMPELEGELLHVPADLSEPGAPAEVIARAVEEFGGVDVLVNNAGGPPPGVSLPRFGFLGLTDEDWHAMLDFNLMSAVRACRAALPLLVDREASAIVNVSSTQGRQPSQVNVDYSAAKAAMSSLTLSLSDEFGPSGVRVNGVSPGPVRTSWWTDEGGAADILAGATGAARDAVITEVAPEMMSLTTGRLAEPEEVAATIVLLASPRAGATTGTEYVVDSGMTKTL